MVVAAAPHSESAATRLDVSAPAGQRIVKALQDLCAEPQSTIKLLERRLQEVWNDFDRRPIEVFERALATKSLTCVAILFGNLHGVKDVAPVYSILEHAASERLTYLAFKLATPEGVLVRPDHTCWFTYSTHVDNCVRASHYEAFAKLNLFELGAQIRRLREKVKYDQSIFPQPNQEFLSEQFFEHLHLLGYIGPWIAALGFDLMGKSSFLEMLRVFSVFCQRGLHYRGQPRETHKRHLHELYLAFMADLYAGFKPFRERRLLSFNESAPFDLLFPPEGKFYSTHRELMIQVQELERLSDRLQDLGAQQVRSPQNAQQRRFIRYQDRAPLEAPRPAPAQRLALTYRSPSPTVGSFAFAVRDSPDYISIMSNKYAKGPILERLNLTENDICLASYLSDKGAAACPHANTAGHERIDSPLHVFSDAVLAMRPSFEQPPFKSLRSAPVMGPLAARRNPGRANRGRGRQVPRLQYQQAQAGAPAASSASSSAPEVPAAVSAASHAPARPSSSY
jgi:hypothetical protein